MIEDIWGDHQVICRAELDRARRQESICGCHRYREARPKGKGVKIPTASDVVTIPVCGCESCKHRRELLKGPSAQEEITV